MRAAVVVVLASLALVITGCSAKINPQEAAKSVVKLVSDETGFKPKDVTCPDGIEAKEGTTFQCTFTGPEGTEYTADMRVTKVEGENVEFYIETAPTD
jgi:hypothetical protein